MLPYEFHPLAARELDEAVAHYEAVLPGKGLELAAEVESVTEQVCRHPESAPISRGTVRSVVVQPTSRFTIVSSHRAFAFSPSRIRNGRRSTGVRDKNSSSFRCMPDRSYMDPSRNRAVEDV